MLTRCEQLAPAVTPLGGQQRDPAGNGRWGMLIEILTSAGNAGRARHAAQLEPHPRQRGQGQGWKFERWPERERTCALLAAPPDPEHPLSLRPGIPRDLALECRDGHDDGAIPGEGIDLISTAVMSAWRAPLATCPSESNAATVLDSSRREPRSLRRWRVDRGSMSAGRAHIPLSRIPKP